MGKMGRDPHNHRNVQSAFVGIALAAGQDAPVITKVEDERVFEQAVRFELRHQPADLLVDDTDAIEVTCVGVSEGRCVRMIGRQLHRLG